MPVMPLPDQAQMPQTAQKSKGILQNQMKKIEGT
jgi:hypothetical protein